MAMSNRRVENGVSTEDYNYVKEDEIDSELKCIICQQPFIKPLVGKRCGHTFCSTCINNWLRQNPSCPTCRRKTGFEPTATRIVLSQLDSLHVRCAHCHHNDIQRGELDNHIQNRCLAMRVKCDAADLKCSWTGLRREKERHSAVCALLQIRPTVESLRTDIQAQGHQFQLFMEEIRNELNRLRNQINYLTRNRPATVNTVQHPILSNNLRERYSQIINDMRHTWDFSFFRHRFTSCKFCEDTQRSFFKCRICSCDIARANVAGHDTSSQEFDVICRSCVNRYRND